MAMLPKPYDRHAYVFRLHTRETNHSGDPFFEIGLTLTQFSVLDDDTSSVVHQEWDGLVLATFGYTTDYGTDAGQRRMAGNGWPVQFDLHGAVGLYQAEAIATTLHRIERALERQQQQAGYAPTTFGAQVQAVMSVLSLDHVIEPAQGGYHGRWKDGTRYRQHRKRDIGPYIDRLIDEWLNPKVEAEVTA